MGFKVIDYINRKKAGMGLVCNLISKDLEGKAKSTAGWTDRTAHARQGLSGSAAGSNGNYTIEISHGVEYGAILEDGSKPHVITAKSGSGLYWKGAKHPVKKVNHPGTEGFHTIEKTFTENKGSVISAIERYWSD